MTYVPSPELHVHAIHGDYRLTKASSQEAYTVWQGGTILAVGGSKLMNEIFNQKKGMKMTNVTTQGNGAAKPKTIEDRVEQYVALRDKIKKMDEEHKEVMEPFRKALEGLNALLLNHLNTIGGESVKSKSGTVYKTVKESVSLEDPAAFMRHVIGTENWELLERKANLTACKEFAEENTIMPPGVKFSSMAVVGVRRGK